MTCASKMFTHKVRMSMGELSVWACSVSGLQIWVVIITLPTLVSGAAGDAKARYVCNNHATSQLKSGRSLVGSDESTWNLSWFDCASGPSKLQVAPALHSNLFLEDSINQRISSSFQNDRKDRKESNRMHPTHTNSAICA